MYKPCHFCGERDPEVPTPACARVVGTLQVTGRLFKGDVCAQCLAWEDTMWVGKPQVLEYIDIPERAFDIVRGLNERGDRFVYICEPGYRNWPGDTLVGVDDGFEISIQVEGTLVDALYQAHRLARRWPAEVKIVSA